MRARRLWFGLLGTLALAGLPAPADAQAVGSEFQVNTYTTGNQGNYPYGAHQVAGDASGNFIVVWSGSGVGDVSGVFGQRYDSAGSRLGGEFRVNSYTTGNQSNYGSPSVAAAAAGDFVVVWQGQGQGDSSGIFGKRYDSAGNAVGGDFLVNAYTTGGQGDVSAAAAADGAFVVAWVGAGDADGGYGVFGQRYDNQGIPQGSEFQVNTATGEFQRHPSVAAAANGSFVVVWLNYFSGNYHTAGQRFDSEGVPQGDEFLTGVLPGHPGDAVNLHGPTTVSVSSDASGNFVVVWDGYDDSYESGIWGQRYDSEGVPQGGVFLVNSYEHAYQYFPSVASDATGNFVVAWRDDRISNDDVFGRRFDSAGVAQGDDFQINSYTTLGQLHPSVGSTSTNQFIVVWGGTGQGDPGGVFGRRVAAFPSLSISDVSVTEGSSPTMITTSPTLARFTVTLSVPSAVPVTTTYATENGSAKAPSDYTATSGMLTLSPGQTSAFIYVAVKKDNLPENNETFSVYLSNPTSATIADGQGVATILNDDP